MGRKKKAKGGVTAPARVDRPGRIRSAWYVLIGRGKTIEQINGEWAIIQAQAAETFNRFNALAARLVRAERNVMKANMDAMTQLELGVENRSMVPGADRAQHKAELRHRAAQKRAGVITGRIPQHVDRDQGSEVSG